MDERFIKFLNIYDEFKEGTALRDILNDAIRCYRHGIARPALMLSYIAFIQAVRNNLLKSEIPSGFKRTRWNTCMNNLRNEDKWDSEVVACIRKRANGTNDPAFFELPDTLRDDVCFWRNRRNDCAHYKDSEITLSHVAAFWVFLMDNYNKFSPIGSLQQSINEYNRHFDKSLTPRGTSTERIFKRLSHVIKIQEDLELFLNATSSNMDFKSQCDLVHDLLIDGYHKELAILFLKGEMKRLKAYLCAKPKDVSLILGNDPTMTRKIWYDDLRLSCRCMNVYVEMLRAKMLTDAEIKESLELYLTHEYEQGHLFITDENDFNVLIDNGIYDIFIDEYLTKSFVCHNPSDKCRKTDFYIAMIYRGGITDKLMSALSEAVTGTFPYTLRDRLKDEIFSEKDFKAKYMETIGRLNFDNFFNLK